MTSDNKSGRLMWCILNDEKVFDTETKIIFITLIKIVEVFYSIVPKAFFSKQIWEYFKWIDYANKFWILFKT